MKNGLLRLAALMLCALMMVCGAAAESAPVAVGRAGDDESIYRYTADNGQDIYFVAREQPVVRLIDVNFDGADDLVVSTVMGASNFYYEFFVWDGAQYVMASHRGAEYGLCNYELFPEKGLVLSSQNNGYAGALFERYLYTWDGSDLKLVRSAISTEYTTVEFGDNTFTTVTDNGRLHVCIRDFTQNIYEGDALYDSVLTLDEMTADAFSELMDKLLEGIE